jgi:hypothetical protein
VPTFDLASARLAPAPGSGGWVWRAAHAAGYVSGEREWGVVGLVAACEGASSPDEVMGRVVAALAGESSEKWPAFALVTAGPSGGVTVLVHGSSDVLVERQNGERLTVAAEGRWSVRVVTGVRRVRLGAGGPARTGLADLRTGVLPAAGAVILAADAGDDLPSLGEAPAYSEAAAYSEAPAYSDAPAFAEAAYDRTSVEPAGGGAGSEAALALVWDSGESDLVTGDMVVGRDPSNDPGIKSGAALPLVPRGRSDGMSRIHADLRRSGWELLVSDRGSTNGTFVWDDDRQEWHRLEADERFPLRVGSIVAFGERTATVESPGGG